MNACCRVFFPLGDPTNIPAKERAPTEVLDGVVALLVVHLDGLRVGAPDAVADAVAAHHDVLVLRRRPAHHDAADQRADVERAGLVRDAGLCGDGERGGQREARPLSARTGCFFVVFFTVQVALERLCRGPLGGRSSAVHRHGRHPEGVLRAALQPWRHSEDGDLEELSLQNYKD